MRSSNELWAAALDLLSPEDRQLMVLVEQDKLGGLTELQRITEDAKARSIEHRWRFRRPGRGGETVVLHDLFTKIATWIHRFKEVGDIVVQYDPAHAALPWAGVRFLLQAVVSDVQKFDFVVEGAEKIARCISRFAIFENVYLDPSHTTTKTSKALEEAMTRLYASIFVYLARAKQYHQQSTPKRVLKAIVHPPEEFERFLLDIETEQASVDRSASLVSEEKSNDITNRLRTLSIDQRDKHKQLMELLARIDGPICRINNQLDLLQDNLDRRRPDTPQIKDTVDSDSKRTEILYWLSSQPYPDHHQQIKKQALKGSGQWLLQDPLYKQWRSDSISSLLWLHGVPGSGKSTLVSIVIDDITESYQKGQNPLPAYFYCTRSAAEPRRSEPDVVLASILRQLSCVEPGRALLSPVVERYKRQGEGFKSRGPPLEQSLDLVKTLTETYGVTTIIVDALDECNPEVRQSLLDAFEEIIQESAGLVKILVSSRDDQDIVWRFRDCPNLHITSKKNTPDIESYVRTETEKLVGKGRLLHHSRAQTEMQELIIDRVSQGADGMFRWATLQLDVLCTLKVDDDVRENLGRLPPKLEELYAAVYAKLTSHHGKSGRSIIENTIKWLLSFLWAIALDLETPVEVESVLDLCHNLVIYDEGLNIFRFAHLSVREFLEKIPEFSEESCNALAAKHCLTHMIVSSKSTFELRKSNIRTISERLLSAERSAWVWFTEYSFDFWMVHCGLASQDARLGDSSFGQLFRFFLSETPMRDSAFDEWAQRYSNTFPSEGFIVGGKKWESWWQLHGLLNRYPNTTLRNFFVAVAYGFSEITEHCVQNKSLGETELKQAVLLAAKAGQQEIFGLLINTRNAELTSEVLLDLIESRNKQTLERLGSKIPSSCFTEQTCHAVIGIEDEWYLGWLLEQYPHLIVTEGVLTHAIASGNTYAFQLLFARTANTMPMGKVLEQAILRNAMAEIKLILATAGSSCLNPALMAYAAREVDQFFHTPATYAASALDHVAIMEFMLTHGGASMISEDVLVNAARDYSGSGEMLKLILDHGGEITQKVLLENAWIVSAEILDILLGHGCEINIGVLEACINTPSTKIRSFDALLSRFEDSVIAPEIARLLCTLANSICQDKSSMIKQLLDRSDKLGMEQNTFHLLRAVVDSGSGRADLIERLLDRTDKTAIAAEMTNLILGLASKIGYSEDDAEMARPLLDRAESSAVTEDILLAALSNTHRRQMLPMLFEKASTIAVTEDVVSQALRKLDSNVIWSVLARVETIDITGDLLAAAAANPYCGDVIIRGFLQKAALTELPVEVIISAMKNYTKGEKVMVALEQSFGPIESTEHIWLSLLRPDTLVPVNLLERIQPEHITEKVLIAAIRSSSYMPVPVMIERSNHVPITLAILEAAVRSGNISFLKFFWNRAHLSEVPQTLIQTAAESNYGIFKFLLVEAKEVQPDEDLFMAIARHKEKSIDMFELLLERDIPLRITLKVLRAAIVAWTSSKSWGWKTEQSPIQWLLDHSHNLEVTDELLQEVAASGRSDTLNKLAKYAGMEDLPGELTNVAKLRNAVDYGDDTTVELLLKGDVEPNVADADGWTPLVVAAFLGQVLTLQMLLTAGANVDQVFRHHHYRWRDRAFRRVTPLHLCVIEDQYEIVKMLVEAGASIEAKDEDGRTPAMLARKCRRIRIWRHLQRCEKEKEERKLELAR